jgi:hypothetical protein
MTAATFVSTYGPLGFGVIAAVIVTRYMVLPAFEALASSISGSAATNAAASAANLAAAEACRDAAASSREAAALCHRTAEIVLAQSRQEPRP